MLPTIVYPSDDIFSNVARLDDFAFGLTECRDVLEFLMEKNPEKEYAEFSDIEYGVYALVFDIVADNIVYALPGIPRLTHNHDDGIFLVKRAAPYTSHEAPFDHLGSGFRYFLLDFKHDDNPVYITVSMNYGLRSATVSAVPDMIIHVQKGVIIGGKSLCIGECAFSQDTDPVLLKLKYEVAAHPEVVMVIMVVIDEHHPYHSPERGSEA
ncbi:uncharacterized protein EDB91DRAFT_1159392 [Suillus paluster]|uniref:uncharacterized protein n=1 Tax=Suillus paluster TaxID=48578 RepID=UPI001B886DFB|nr:uncharacterized protein EDB91DRAFT_1159392 [Suillus paluster]KAG1729501.1 hypothetical protein EDB91DRAFT_1159392 [Suillus paluster]